MSSAGEAVGPSRRGTETAVSKMEPAAPAASYEASHDIVVQPGAIVGLLYKPDALPAQLGHSCLIRAGAVIYGDVTIGDFFQCGHNAVVREYTRIGAHVVVGTNTVVDGTTEIDDYVKIESNCYIPTHTKIGTRVFMGPGVALTNDRYPLKMRDLYKPQGPIIEDGVTLGAGVVVVPGVTIGKGSFIAAGAVVTKDVPPMSLVTGVPGRISPLPDRLTEMNTALSWRRYLES